MEVTRESLRFTWGDAGDQSATYITRVEDSSTSQVQSCITTCVVLIPGENCRQVSTCTGLTSGQEYCITVRILRDFNTDIIRTDCKRTSKTPSF